jgi:hypothetical protein
MLNFSIPCILFADELKICFLRCGKQMEKLPHYNFSWTVSLSKNREICEMLRLEIKRSGGKLLPHSDLRGGVSLEETPRKARQYSIGTWNVRTSNQGGKLENLKKEMEKNGVFAMGVGEVRWKGQGEIRSGDYTMY